MSERLTTHALFRDVAEEQQEDMMDGIEKHLMTNIFPMLATLTHTLHLPLVPLSSSLTCRVYSPDSCDDAMRDLLLVRKIRMLHWLEPTHLDIPLDLHNLQVRRELFLLPTLFPSSPSSSSSSLCPGSRTRECQQTESLRHGSEESPARQAPLHLQMLSGTPGYELHFRLVIDS